MRSSTVLLVEDDDATAYWVRRVLQRQDDGVPRVVHVRTLRDALAQLAVGGVECVVLDVTLPDSEGLASFAAVQRAAPRVAVVLLTSLRDETLGVEAVRRGAQDFLSKDAPPEQIARAVHYALLRARWEGAVSEAARLEAVLDSISDAYLTVDEEGRVTYANRAAEHLFHTGRAEILGRPLAECLPALEESSTRAGILRSGGGPAPAEIEEYLPALGKWVEVRLYPSPGGTTAYLRDTTANHSAEDERLLHQQVLDAIPAGVVISAVGKPDRPIVYMNPAFERMTGYPPAEVLGRDCRFLQGPATDRAAVRRIGEALDARQPVRLDLLNYRRDGSTLWNDLAVAPIYGTGGEVTHFVGVQQDATDRKVAEKALREAQRATAALLSNLPGMAYRCADDRRWPMYFVSEGALELTGYAPERLVGPDAVPYGDLIHPADRGRVWSEVQEAIAEARPFELTYRIVTLGGAEKWVWEQGRGVTGADGELLAVEGFATDTTRQKALEEQLRQAQKMDAVGRLAAGIAHDFNNLLTAIKGTAALMLMDLPEDDPMRADAVVIGEAADRAAALTRQLLAFGRGHVVKSEILDLNRVVAETAKLLRRLIPSGIELSTVLDPDLATLRADAGQLEQVLVNLVVNARDAMPDGGTVIVETMNLHVDAWPTGWAAGVEPGRYVMLVVHDTGTGIDPETQARIFEPFFTTKEVGAGTGLGLSIVYGIVQQSGGMVRVFSRPGAGTTFRLLFPCAATQPLSHVGCEPVLAARGWSGTVLLVDDEPAVRRATHRMLERAGFAVIDAPNGEEALRIARAHPGPIDLLLTDVVMPLMGGPELAGHLARERPDTPVLFVSGYSEENAFPGGRVGTDGRFLHKPFTLEALMEAAGRLLRHAPESAG
jgi:PAS domain S-box-containing protein